MSPTDPWWIAPAIVAAVIAAAIALITLLVNGRRARADRQRQLFGAAFGDIASYCEFPYVVRRRRHDRPDEERIRISTELSDVQRKLNHHRAVLRVESPRVARAYSDLIDATRQIAGSAIRDGWDRPAATGSSAHVGNVDLSEMRPREDCYLTAVADHLAITPWWVRTGLRWVTCRAALILRSSRQMPATPTLEEPQTDAKSPEP